MPQLNSHTYLSITTWTIIIFYIFYYIMKQYILPLIYENIKIKKLLGNSNTISSNGTSNQMLEPQGKDKGYIYFSNYYNNFFSK